MSKAEKARRDGLLAAGVILAAWWWSNRQREKTLSQLPDSSGAPLPLPLPDGRRPRPDRTGTKKDPFCNTDLWDAAEREKMQETVRDLLSGYSSWGDSEEVQQIAFDVTHATLSQLCPNLVLPSAPHLVPAFRLANKQLDWQWHMVHDYVMTFLGPDMSK